MVENSANGSRGGHKNSTSGNKGSKGNREKSTCGNNRGSSKVQEVAMEGATRKNQPMVIIEEIGKIQDMVVEGAT